MSFTTNKGIDIIARGTTDWDVPVNANSTLIDKAFGSVANITERNGTVTLTLADYQCMCLKTTESDFLATLTLVIPSGVAGQWVVINQSGETANNYQLRIKNAGDAEFLTIPRGEVRSVYSDGNTVFFADTREVIPVEVPAGAVSMFARNTAPSGWLKANGAAVSRTTYADLFDAIGTTFGAGNGSTTFNVPELRGEFLRSWADGRSVDTGRIFGSAQSDAIQNITGVFAVAAQTSGFTGAFETGTNTSRLGGDQAFTTTRVEFDASNVVRTATETRARNVALLACIKY
jgi:phage-related tail fiber protein